MGPHHGTCDAEGVTRPLGTSISPVKLRWQIPGPYAEAALFVQIVLVEKLRLAEPVPLNTTEWR